VIYWAGHDGIDERPYVYGMARDLAFISANG
jgi:hypothetical protein